MIIRDTHKDKEYFLVAFMLMGMGVILGISERKADGEPVDTDAVTPRSMKHFRSQAAGKKNITFDMLFLYSRNQEGVPVLTGSGRVLGMLKPEMNPDSITITDGSNNTVILDLFGQIVEKIEVKDSKIITSPIARKGIGDRFVFVAE